VPSGAGAAALRTALKGGDQPENRSPPWLADSALCRRQEAALRLELQRLDAGLAARLRANEAIGRLLTVPASAR
jgi:hypothetical protein